MDPARLTSLPSLRRQHLLAEFTGLRQACPSGVFVSLTPGDLTLWSGVIFVRNGPYAPAILRFQISFPDRYPTLPPLVTFSTDIFHPLVTPLTTYTYTTDIQSGGTVSATDDERLPPGGFSLRHGFPAWFGRGARHHQQSSSRQSSRQSSGQSAGPLVPPGLQTPPRPGAGSPASTRNSGRPAPPHLTPPPPATPSYMQTRRPADEVSTYDVLHYIRSTFDDATVLDAVPLDAAGNPGAWHAWRSHRRQQAPQPESSGGSGDSGDSGDRATAAAAAAAAAASPAPAQASDPTATRKPGEWNWEHVWEERVKNGINVSLSDPVLYGSAGAADDVIRFLQMDDGDIEAIKENLKRTLDASA